MLSVKPAKGYKLHERTKCTINDNKTTKRQKGQFEYTFPKLPEDKTTGIENVSADEDGKWYNLNGTEVSGKPAKGGIYIFNGHKVVVNK